MAEMKAFITVILNMGLNRNPTIQSYWATSDSQYTPLYGKMISRARFESIIQFFHMVDNSRLHRVGQPGYDHVPKCCPCWKPQIDYLGVVIFHTVNCWWTIKFNWD